MKVKYSVVIPVYKNEDSIARLLKTLDQLSEQLGGVMEAVFVVDGSPDRSTEILLDAYGDLAFPTQIISHSRNFGSFAAIRTGLENASGEYTAMMAADLQEPPELILDFFAALETEQYDVTVGARSDRSDGWAADFSSKLFWTIYRKLVNPEIPDGGVDIFACNNEFKDKLLTLNESRSSLVALVYWLGFRRKTIRYHRLPRLEGSSSWSFSKKFDYMVDSVFAFTELPIKVLIMLGLLGLIASSLLGITIILARLLGYIELPGYAPVMLAVLSLGSLNLLAVGVVGNYAWRAYENSKMRPLAVVLNKTKNHHYDE